MIPSKGKARNVEGSDLLDSMTDASELENVVAGDVEYPTSDKEEEELEKTEESTTTSAALEMFSASLRLCLYPYQYII